MQNDFLTTERKAELLGEIIRLQSHVNEVADAQHLFEPILDVLVEYSESEFGFIGEVFTDDTGQPFLQTHAITNIAWNAETRDLYARNAKTGFDFRNLDSLFGAVLRTGEAVISNDPTTDPRRGGTPDGHPVLKAFMGLPFYQRGVMVGMAGVANREGGYCNSIQEAMDPILASCAFIIDTFRIWNERAEFESKVRNSEALHRGILDAAVDSIISIDSRGIIMSANSAVTKMFGYTPSEIVGQNVRILMPQEFGKDHDTHIKRHIETGEARIIGVGREVTGLHRDGTRIPLELAISKVHQDERLLFTGILRDIRDRKRVEQERAEAYSQLVAVLNSCSEISVIATDETGLITVFNRGAENMLKYPAETMIGKQTPAVIHDPGEVEAYGAELSEQLGRSVTGFQVFIERTEFDQFDRREWTYVRSDGSRVRVDLTVTAVRDEAGDVTGYLGVAVDVTERNRAQMDLVHAKEAAESANKAKSDFLANMSHEIRTPINGIIGMEELLRGTSLTPEQSQYVEALGSCATGLLSVINDVLDYSKIEAGHLDIHFEPIHLRALVTKTLEPLRIRALQNGLNFVVTVDPLVPDDLESDPVRIRQVLLNLVSNAVKFTNKGEIAIRVYVVSQTQSGVILRFDVHDTGAGIPTAAQSYIFDPFTQSDNSTTRKFGGTGLGLSIARRLVQLLGGEIWFDSNEGEGTVFHFTIAARNVANAPARPQPIPVNEPFAPVERVFNILIAEDHPVNQLFASRLLEKYGHRVTIVENGKEAVERVSSEDFDIVLMDIQMPVMDGLEAISRIRRNEAASGSRIPIVALTAHAMKDYDQQCYAAGADAYISKPLRPVDLKTTIDKLATSCRSRVPACHSAFELPVTAPETNLVNKTIILDSTGNDLELANELIEIFQTDLPTTIQQLEDAIRDENLELVARLAHSLKSPLMMFGATAVRDDTHKLENVARDGITGEIIPVFQTLRHRLAEVSELLESMEL